MGKIIALYFSPTGNTKKVACYAAEVLENICHQEIQYIDVTMPVMRQEERIFAQDDFVIVAVPTYAGKMPNKLLPFFQEKIRGNKTKVLAMVTYGNRSFDNALAELCGTLTNNDFCVMGAGAMVGEHPFSEKLGTNRPDEDDLAQLSEWVERVWERSVQEGVVLGKEDVPGDAAAAYYTPLGTDGAPAVFLKAKPVTDGKRCTGCGMCVTVCPMGSVNPMNVNEVTGICIKCQACVKKCPAGAKTFEDKAFLSHVSMLEAHYENRKENLFI